MFKNVKKIINIALYEFEETKRIIDLISEEVEQDIKESKEQDISKELDNIRKNSEAQKNIDRIKKYFNNK